MNSAARAAVARLRERAWTSRPPTLARTRALLDALGNPENTLKFVHVAGTNGKGSTSAMLASILTAAGYRTGLYTSPHLVRFTERMSVDGAEITDEALVTLTDRVLAAAEACGESCTEFELMTALGLLYFAELGCDIVVLEVGLGGRLDSTNVIPAPETAVITNIGLEHTAILGDTLEKIAREKAGILKSGSRAVLYAQTEEVMRVVRNICREKAVPLTVTASETLETRASALDGQVFTYRSKGPYRLPLLGDYQRLNAAAALDTVDALRERGWAISDDAISRGLAAVRWPCRLELVRRNPDFLIDGAHNPQCADALAASLEKLCGDKKLVFLAGVLADKNWQSMFDCILPLAKAFVTLTPASDRALPADTLADYLRTRGAQAHSAASLEGGIQKALALAGENGAVCFFGSLYAAGEVRQILAKM